MIVATTGIKRIPSFIKMFFYNQCIVVKNPCRCMFSGGGTFLVSENPSNVFLSRLFRLCFFPS